MTVQAVPALAPVIFEDDRTCNPPSSDALDCLVLVAVWCAWADERRPPSIREIKRLINRGFGRTWSRVNRLISEGWLMHADGRPYAQRDLIPGPRFAGLDGVTPLERRG